MICHMHSPKTSARMPFEDPIALREQLRFCGEALADKAPIRMDNQLLVSFIVAVDPSEESVGIGRMDRDGQTPLPSLFPHTVQPGVIDAYQFAPSVTNAESEILQHLDSFCPSYPGFVEHLYEIVRFVKMRVVDLAKNKKPARKRLRQVVQRPA